MPSVHKPRDPAQVQRWLDRIRVGGLRPGLADAAEADGVTLELARSYLARWHRDAMQEARQDYLIAQRGSGAKRGAPNVPELEDGTSRLYELRPGRASLRVNLTQLRDDLLADIRGYERDKGKPFAAPKQGLLHVVSPADLHIGKLAWEPETGEDFDSKIASDRLRDALHRLVCHASHYSLDRHLFVVGNDLLQVDNLMSTTTAGTFQDTDSRYRKMFRLAVKLMREAIDTLADTARVDVIVVPGNHDQLASFHVGEVLQAIFDGHKRVYISSDIRPRVYQRFGATLLGFTHGNEEKHVDLPLIMAQENHAAWGQTTYREFLVGHLHKKRERSYNVGDSHNGVRVIVLPSLTGTDSWHAKKGYIGEPKASESRLYDKDEGLVATFTARVG